MSFQNRSSTSLREGLPIAALTVYATGRHPARCKRDHGGTWFPHGHGRPHSRGAPRPRSRPRFTSGIVAAGPGGMPPARAAPPPPGPSPAGGGHPASPPGGGRLGGGLNAANDGHLGRPCGSAAPRRDAHRFFLGGRIPFPVEHSAFVEVLDRTVTPCKAIHNPTSAIQNGRSPPTPSHRVRVWGNPVSPDPCARAAPSPSRGRGCGETRFPHTPAPAACVHVSRPCGSAAHRRDEHPSWEGRPRPDPPAGGGVGQPGYPSPLRAGSALPTVAWFDAGGPLHPGGLRLPGRLLYELYFVILFS